MLGVSKQLLSLFLSRANNWSMDGSSDCNEQTLRVSIRRLFILHLNWMQMGVTSIYHLPHSIDIPFTSETLV